MTAVGHRLSALGQPLAASRSSRLLTLSAALLIPLSFCLFFSGLAERDLWSSHEARAAQNAQGMLQTGQWALPRLYDRRLELQKPPLFYWLVAATAWLRGGTVDAWAVRLPAALAALGGVALPWFLGWRRGRPLAGLLAGVMLATMLHYTWLGRVGRIDMPLTLAVTVALIGYYLGSGERSQKLAATLGYIALAVAVLLKGPIGVVLPAVVIILHQLMESLIARRAGGVSPLFGNRREQGAYAPRSPKRTFWWGIPLVLLLTLPWFLWVNHQTQGEFFRIFFWHHNLQRGLGGDELLEAHPWWFYAVRIWPDLFPWCLLLPLALWFLWRGWPSDPEARFGLVWFAGMALLLSCMSFKRADYLLPAYPGVALLLGCTVERWVLGLASGWRRAVYLGVGGVALACAAGWLVHTYIILPRMERQREQATFAAEVRRHVPAPAPILLFRTEAHLLIFHLGPPVDRLMEWENLDIWVSRDEPIYVVMPPECVAQWHEHLQGGRLFPVTSNSELAGVEHELPLVLMCNRPPGNP